MKRNSGFFKGVSADIPQSLRSPQRMKPSIKMPRALSVLGSLTLIPLFLTQANAEPIKIATVDMQRALQSVESGRNAKTQLEKEFNARKKELQAEEANLKKMAEELKKQSLVLSDEARAKKQGELQERYLKLQEQTGRSQMELQQKERELTQPIVEQLKTLISELGKSKGTTILEKTAVLYAPEKDDLTDELISAFNKQSKSPKAGKASKKEST